MCYSALYLWLVGCMYRASGLAAFSFGLLMSGPINAHFFESSGAVSCLFSVSFLVYFDHFYISFSGFRPALLSALCRMATFLFVLISSSFGF